MKFIFTFFLSFLLFYDIAYCQINIKRKHPRLFFDQNEFAKIKTSIKTYSKKEFDQLYINRYKLEELSLTSMKKDAYSSTIVGIVAIFALLSDDDYLINKAISYAIALAEVKASTGNDTAERHRLLSLAVVYDLLYNYLTHGQKIILKNSIIKHIDHIDYFLDDPLYTGGHSRFGSFTIMAGLIAIYGDYGNWHGKELLVKIKNQWEKGYNPFQSYSGQAGGYHMGWRYGPAYTGIAPYLCWKNATGESWCEDWISKQGYWFIYGLRGDQTWPRAGDCWNVSLYDSNIPDILAACSGIFKDSYAEWFYQKYYSNRYPIFNTSRILTRDPDVKPIAPDDNEIPLHLARHFKNSGYFVARDAWDKSTTHVVFKSSPFYTRNHHHKDQNHIEISYKGSLLIDSGGDKYGTSHYWNYYTRTIAHNTMVVFDKNEIYVDGINKVPNDGGQKFPNYLQQPIGNEPKNLEEAKSSKYKIDGIIAEDIGKGYFWARGDATKAYNNSKVKTYFRDLLMVNRPIGRNHPYILILDRIELHKELTPRILFHFNNKPNIESNYFGIENLRGGFLHGEIFSTNNITIKFIGGKGKRWWVNGKNYYPKIMNKHVDMGWGRLEVGINSPEINAEFLTLLIVDDKGNYQGRPNASFVSGDGYYGILDGKNALIIITKEIIPINFIFQREQYKKIERIFLAGLVPNKEFTININNATHRFVTKNRSIELKISLDSDRKVMKFIED